MIQIIKKLLYSVSYYLVLALGPATAQVLTSNLVGEWKFNGDATDSSGSGNNCTVINATLTADRFGNASSAYHFLGISSMVTGSYLTTTSHQNLPYGKQDFSVNMWASVQQPIAGDWRILFCNNQWDNFQLGLGTDLYNTKRMQLHYGQGVPDMYTEQLNWNDAQWYMITVTGNNGIINFYRDGLNMATVDVSSYDYGNKGNGDNLNLSFGGRPNPSNTNLNPNGLLTLDHPWIGNLDDIKIYNRALSANEVQTLYATESVPETSALSLLAVGLGGLAMLRCRRS
jgi:hypothetical protein